MAGIIFIFCIATGVMITIIKERDKEQHKRELEELNEECVRNLITVSVKSAKQTKQTKQTKQKKKDPLFKEAKEMLVNMGYSATEAKDLLQGVSGNDVQEYVQKAMEKVKV